MSNWRSSLMAQYVYRYPGGSAYVNNEHGFSREIKIKTNAPVLCINQIGDNYYNLVVLDTEDGEIFTAGQYFMAYGWKQNPEIKLKPRQYHLLLAGEKVAI